MATDATDILASIGVSLPEVERYLAQTWGDATITSTVKADAAILALAREVAKYKWVAEHGLWGHSGSGRIYTRKATTTMLLARYDEAQHE